MSIEDGPVEERINIEELASDPHPRPLTDLERAREEMERIGQTNVSVRKGEGLIKKGVDRALHGVGSALDRVISVTYGISRGIEGSIEKVSRTGTSVLEKARPYLESLKRRG